MIPFTTSNFLNVLLEKIDCHPYNLRDTIKEYKDEVKTEIDKWFYNQIAGEKKFDCSFEPSNYSDEVFSRNVSLSGISKTDYGEFVRAFNKLAYRWFNDGDCPVSGPYSAINYFLKEEKGSRKFGWDIEEFKLLGHSEVVFGDEYDVESEYETKFNHLLSAICGFPSLFLGNPTPIDTKKWCDSFIVVIDQLHDDIKGLEKCYHSVDEYYKNSLEFKYVNIFEWLSNTFNNDKWCYEYDDQFSNAEQLVTIEVINSRQFTIQFNVSVMSLFEKTKKITIFIDNEIDQNFIDTLKKFYKITKGDGKQNVTVSEYTNYFSNRNFDKMLIVPEGDKIVLKTQPE